MIPYLIMLMLPMIGSFGLIRLKNNSKFLLLYLYLLLLILFIGLRHEVGGDWGQYYHNYNNPQPFDFFYLGINVS